MREELSEADYADFFVLFDQENMLKLTSMSIQPSARRVISQIAQDCLSRESVALPDGSSIRLLNLQQILKQQALYVALSAEDGVAVLPAYHFERTLPSTHQPGLVLNCPVYIVERDEKDRPTIAVILDPKTGRIERMFVDLVYNLPIWVPISILMR